MEIYHDGFAILKGVLAKVFYIYDLYSVDFAKALFNLGSNIV